MTFLNPVTLAQVEDAMCTLNHRRVAGTGDDACWELHTRFCYPSGSLMRFSLTYYRESDSWALTKVWYELSGVLKLSSYTVVKPCALALFTTETLSELVKGSFVQVLHAELLSIRTLIMKTQSTYPSQES